MMPDQRRSSKAAVSLRATGATCIAAVLRAAGWEVTHNLREPGCTFQWANHEVCCHGSRPLHIPRGWYIASSMVIWDQQLTCKSLPGRAIHC